jgi:hypothetical protein
MLQPPIDCVMHAAMQSDSSGAPVDSSGAFLPMAFPPGQAACPNLPRSCRRLGPLRKPAKDWFINQILAESRQRHLASLVNGASSCHCSNTIRSVSLYGPLSATMTRLTKRQPETNTHCAVMQPL